MTRVKFLSIDKKMVSWLWAAELMAIVVLAAGCTATQTKTPADKTGVAELDQIITVVLAGDAAGMRALLGFTQMPCTFAEGLGGPPKCLQNEQEGTAVEVLPVLGPGEGSFVRKADLENWPGVQATKLVAVYQVSPAAARDVYAPPGDYALVFLGDPKTQISYTLHVRDGHIVRIDTSLGIPPQIPTQDVRRYLIGPG